MEEVGATQIIPIPSLLSGTTALTDRIYKMI